MKEKLRGGQARTEAVGTFWMGVPLIKEYKHKCRVNKFRIAYIFGGNEEVNVYPETHLGHSFHGRLIS